MKITVFGQALIHRPVVWPKEMRALAHGADAVICNFEGCLPTKGLWPMKRKTVHAAHPDAPGMLADLGVTHLSIANNHVWDYGHAGILSTRAAIERAGLVAAGAGISATEAASAVIRNGVALLAVDAGPTPDWAIANDGPGVNAVRISRKLGLPAKILTELIAISRESGDAERRAKRQAIGYDAADTSASFHGLPLEENDRVTEIWQADQADVEQLITHIRTTRALADCVMVSLHYHTWASDWSQAPDWLSQLCSTLLDAGADGVICTGPPVAIPTEIQGAKVCAPGLGNLVFHTARGATYDRLQIPVWQGTALQFENGIWTAHPIEVLR